MLSNLAQSSGMLREVYRLECVHCKEKQLTASYRSNDETRLGEYCCNAAFHVIVDKAAPSPSHLLHDSIIVGDDEGQDDQRCSSFVDRELVGPEFWNGFFRTTSTSRTKCSFLDKDRPFLNSSSEWTMHQRDRFVDGFFSFGWNRGRDVMTYSGLAIDEDLYEVMCRGILRVLLASVRRHTFSYELIANFVRASEGEHDCAAEDMASISKGVFAKEKFRETLSSKAHKLMKRISVLHFLRSFAETTQVDVDDLRLSQPGPASWWTKEHDRALAIGICKYGMSHYEFFECDEDKRLRDISRYHDGQRLSYAQLNKRAEEVANKALDVLMNMDTKEDLAKCISETKLGESWNVDEIQAVLGHLEAHGIELDKDGEYDWEAVAGSLNGIDRPQDEISSFIEELLWMCEYHSKEIGVDTINSLFMLKKRINGMYQLRMLFLGHTDAEVKEILSKVPKWRIMSNAWTPDLEFAWLSELLLHGFGAHLPVFETEEMHQVSGNNSVPEVFKHDLHIIQRIAVIFEHAKANHLVNDHMSQQTKARKIDATAPAVSQAVPGPDTEIEYPIMITPNSFIHNLGTIEYKRPGFHSERYIYPIGFKTSRISASLDNPDERTRWYSEIIDTGENTPVFRVWMEGRPNTIFQGVTPTAPWSQALKAVASCRRNKGKVTSISGPEAFLLASPIATYLIQNLPNADKCTNYVMRNVSANPHIRRLYDKTQEAAEPDPDSDERLRPPEPTPDHADPATRRKK